MVSNQKNLRMYTPLDRLIITLDQCMRAFNRPHSKNSSYPADQHSSGNLTTSESRKVSGMMRVNHTGEVCAQALYIGQSLTARNPSITQALKQAAEEEIDHLDWCQARLTELNSRPSYLNPLWFTGSLSIGIMAGIAGDKFSLGFLSETENQVVKHLEKHLERLPLHDQRSRAILEQMKFDEAQHATLALEQGGIVLPAPIRFSMKLTAKIMTSVAYYF